MKHVDFTVHRTAPTGIRVSNRSGLLRSALRLSYFTIAWNGVLGALALIVSIIDESPALAGFALNALLDSSASIVLVWRFRRERRDPAGAERLERRAQYGVATAMVLVALYVGVQAIRGLMEESHPKASIFGAIVATLSGHETASGLTVSMRAPGIWGFVGRRGWAGRSD